MAHSWADGCDWNTWGRGQRVRERASWCLRVCVCSSIKKVFKTNPHSKTTLQTDKSPSATITFPSKATSIFLVSSNVIAPEACWIGPGKGGLETAKSTSQQSSSNLGRNVITFEFNSFPSFFSYSAVLISFHSRWRSQRSMEPRRWVNLTHGQWKSPTVRAKSRCPPFCVSRGLLSGSFIPTKSVVVRWWGLLEASPARNPPFCTRAVDLSVHCWERG